MFNPNNYWINFFIINGFISEISLPMFFNDLSNFSHKSSSIFKRIFLILSRVISTVSQKALYKIFNSIFSFFLFLHELLF